MTNTPAPPATTTGSLHDDVPCGYLRTTDDGLIVDADRTLLATIGRARADVVGRLRFVDLLSGGSRIYYETHVRPLLYVDGEVSALALELRHADGGRRAVLVNARSTSADRGVAEIDIATFDAGERRPDPPRRRN